MNRPIEKRVERLRDKLVAERKAEIARAVEFHNQGNEPKAMYHTGLADGRNRIVHELDLILSGSESVWLSK